MIITRLLDMPYSVRAFTLYDSVSDTFNVYLNSRLPSNIQRKAYDHEIEHIENDDFNTSDSVDVIERRMCCG